jgi:hypothetical protein
MSSSHRKRRVDIEDLKSHVSSCFEKDLKLTREEAQRTLDQFLEEKKDNNNIIILQFKAMELIKSLGDEPFKIKAYREARREIEKYPLPIVGIKQVEKVKGFGKSTTRFLSVILEELNEREEKE